MKRLPGLLLTCQLALGQQPVTAPPGQANDVRRAGLYSVSGSAEGGYRFATAAGDLDLYRASVNYGNGFRLFEGAVRLHSLDGRGRLVDEFSLRTSGAVGDPYQAHVLRAEKNGLYRYDLQHRTIRFHNRLPTLWSGEHGLQTERTLQTHDLLLRPGAGFEVLLGYDRNRRSGPGFSSEGIADREGGFEARNFLRYRTDLQQANDQYRAGFTARFIGLALTAQQALDLYREDAGFSDGSRFASLAPNVQPVEALRRTEPFDGRTPVTTLALQSTGDRRIGFNARYVYANGSRNSTLREDISVRDPAANAATQRETFVIGSADRDQSSGELTVVALPTARWSITHVIAFHNTRIDGQASFLEVGLYRNEFLSFDRLGIRRLSTATEANFRPTKALSLYGAYRSSTRRVGAAEALRFPDFGFKTELATVDNRVHSGAVGFRWLPARRLRASFDFEAGIADRPLTPTSERRFHNESARLRWRGGKLTLSGYFRNRANDNPTDLLAYSSRARAAGAQASWADPRTSLVLDAGYSALDLDVGTGILNLFALEEEGPERGRSVYASRIHNLNIAVQASPHDRLTVHAGFALTKDIGDGRERSPSDIQSRFSRRGANLFVSLPLTYQSPQARLSVTLRDNLSWDFGWQYYRYAEPWPGRLGFRAHVGFSSFRIGL